MSENKTKTSNTTTTTANTPASDNEISLTIPISYISDKIYSKTFDEESDPIYQEELQGKAIIAGKSVTLFRLKPTLRLRDIKIDSGSSDNKQESSEGNGKAKAELTGQAWFHILPKDDTKTHDEDDDYSSQQIFRADLDVSIDQRTGRIQINPKYATLEAKVGIAISKAEPFCQLTIPLKLESLKMEFPVGVRTSNVSLSPPAKKTFIINSGSEFIEGNAGQDDNIVFRYPIEIEEQKK
jgi:hypothetical protein